ncbi:hypothetical protein G3N95_32560 [Paraburkholderia sp. Tr-20389]|uniref:hypothetical protein n=1 Tax=Paraburkholderia sp. Tr-20389 TaxID=2703903 RepID=UPI00198039D6|nr:hypothetical protein [Paraburkholderia sp. Tr-20389]MBN3757695.1 hypothetical protein [Paraburkholderia sp. Tr-20389]
MSISPVNRPYPNYAAYRQADDDESGQDQASTDTPSHSGNTDSPSAKRNPPPGTPPGSGGSARSPMRAGQGASGPARSARRATSGLRPGMRLLTQRTHTGAAAPDSNTASAGSSGECQNLLERYEGTKDHPTDTDNANGMADVAEDAMRGMPQDEVTFVRQVIRTNLQINALSQPARGLFRATLAALFLRYESATSTEDRLKLAKQIEDDVIKPVDTAYAKAMADPQQRAQMEFRPPYGYGVLGSSGQYQADLLRQLGQQFNAAKTPAQREAIFAQAARLRQSMQQYIQAAEVREKGRLDAQWAEADRELDKALDEATGITGEGQEVSFNKLTYFMGKAFTSPRNAQEFAYRMQHDPQHFQVLKDWSRDAAQKSQWAADQVPYWTKANHWDYGSYKESIRIPPAPEDITNVDTSKMRMGNFANDLLYRYQSDAGNIANNAQMHHAVQQGGPIRDGWINAHMPPKPLWLARLEEGIGRFALDSVPGVNMFADVLEPAPHLSSDEKFGIDVGGGALGTVAGEAKLPDLPVGNEKLGRGAGKLGDAHAGSKGAGGEGIGAKGGDVKPGETGESGAGKEEATAGKDGDAGHTIGSGGATGDGAGGAMHDPARSTVVPGVPDTYASRPSGELTADPQYRGIYRDSRGQGYIRQGDTTFAVKYDKDNESWNVQSPDGGARPPYAVRLNSNGNWEFNPDTGLKGGSGRFPGFRYTEEDGKKAYEDHERRGRTYGQIGNELGIPEKTAYNWANKYAEDNGFEMPRGRANVTRANVSRSNYTPELGQTVYEDHELRGRTYAQIANELGIPDETALDWATKYEKENGSETPHGSRPGYTEVLGQKAYEDYVDLCFSYPEVAKDLKISPYQAEAWVKKYQLEHDKPTLPAVSRIEASAASRNGRAIYEDLLRGRSLEETASKRAFGNKVAAYRGAMHYVQTGLDTHGNAGEKAAAVRVVNDAQARDIGTAPAVREASPAARPVRLMDIKYPMTADQYSKIRELYGTAPTADIARQTGVPEASVKAVGEGSGYYSNIDQAYVRPISDQDTEQPAAKRPRVDTSGAGPSGIQSGGAGQQASATSPQAGHTPPSPAGSTGAPPQSPGTPPVPQTSSPHASSPGSPAQPAGTPRASDAPSTRAPSPVQPEIVWTRDIVPQWGRAELRKALDPAHADELDPVVRKAIVDWIDGKAPAPESLDMEMYEQGFFGLTSEQVRKYFKPDLQPPLTDAEVAEIGEWLNSFD